MPAFQQVRNCISKTTAQAVGKQYIAILAGVGGWSGAIVAGGLDPRDQTAKMAALRKPTDRLLFTSPPRFVCVKPDSYIQTPCNSIAVGPIANGAGIIVASREV
jgi:hypothetical protein